MRDKLMFSASSDNDDQPQARRDTWKILIVDDDESVHSVTRLVLKYLEVENRSLEFISAYSAKEAQTLLKKEDNIAMAFVDVVMETDDAGLTLVRWIRQELKNQKIRLILRTGQAGKAPEHQVVKDFDINDYKDKTEFSSDRMITCVYSAIRGYRDIITIEKSLEGFRKLIEASNFMLKMRELRTFSTAALEHLLNLMELNSSALYIAHSEEDIFHAKKHLILACTGRYVNQSDDLGDAALDPRVKDLISRIFNQKTAYIDNQSFVGYYETAANTASVLYVEFHEKLEPFKVRLLEMYATNLALILETIATREEIERTQKELMYILGDAIEARSKETGAHVKRVALICEKMAIKLGLSEPLIKAIKFSAPLHDIGKVAIPETILHKPGKLDAEEWEIMKTHAEIGGELLRKSDTTVAKVGARLAQYHHENWDGSGYPEGLKGEEIPLEARLMAVADVFDALGSTRSYKKPWPNDQIKAFIVEQSGIKFEPRLVDILLDNFDEFLAIRDMLPDHEE